MKKLTITIPKDTDEEDLLSEALIDAGVHEVSANLIAQALAQSYDDKRLSKAFEDYGDIDGGRLDKQLRKCVLQEFIGHITTGSPFKPKKCAGIAAHQAKNFLHIDPEPVLKYASRFVTKAASVLRLKKARFFRHKHTASILEKHRNINPDALFYLHLNNKLNLSIEDFEIFETFLETMIAKKETL